MLEYIWEIGASGWFYYEEVCFDARSHERKKKVQGNRHSNMVGACCTPYFLSISLLCTAVMVFITQDAHQFPPITTNVTLLLTQSAYHTHQAVTMQCLTTWD